jgi:hypothetical protein
MYASLFQLWLHVQLLKPEYTGMRARAVGSPRLRLPSDGLLEWLGRHVRG